MADPHEERFELRLTREQKERLERAALITGQPLSGFVRTRLLKEADKVIEEQTTRQLTSQDFDRFLRAIGRRDLNPQLVDLLKRHPPRE